MIVGQKVTVGVRGGRKVPGIVVTVLTDKTAEIRVKPGSPESYIVVGAILVDAYPEDGQFCTDEDDEAAELRIMEEAEARAAAELAAAKAARGPGVVTPDTQDPPRDENGNLIVTVPAEPAPVPVTVPEGDEDINE